MDKTFNHTGYYVCECGKEFENCQSFNGHRSHCREHYIAKYGDEVEYNKMCVLQRERANYGSQKRAKELLDKRNFNLKKWLESEPRCEKCGKIMTEKYGSGRFCSRFCANSRKFSEDTKIKISKSLSNKMFKLWQSDPERWTTNRHRNNPTCKICGKELSYENVTGFCSICLCNTNEGKTVRIEAGKKGYETQLKNGTHKPWQSRNVKSYAEQFWEQVLNNNDIKFLREFVVKHDDSNYFLDFLIEINDIKIDLEIDGKQHSYVDRVESDKIRDEYLKTLGYIIYRIPWNEIKTDVGKNLMKDKIDNFISFYKSLLK